MTTPSPGKADDGAAFVAELRRLKAWSGLSYRRLERRAAEAGESLPYSTASTMLGRESLPREELLVAFVRACGLDGDDVDAWVAARRRIAAGVPVPAATPSRRERRAGRRAALVGAAAAFVFGLTGGVAFAMGTGGEVDVVEAGPTAPGR
ncbi:helix-turn-helix domain-containing protein [Actinomadura kijaniata]|uniref:helix-turn-helix domain-containing protein n=1 Tax=Actinomadura kijaniata TaxID=46161 RepID=UPI00082FEE1F|nr:helix-turn-helix transcriptional regulator [Actinomadura kijaniata]